MSEKYIPKVGDVLRQRSWIGRVTVLGVGKYKFLGAREDGNEYIYDITGHDWIKVEPQPVASAATPSDRYVPKVGDRVRRGGGRPKNDNGKVTAVGDHHFLVLLDDGMEFIYNSTAHLWIKAPVTIEGEVYSAGGGEVVLVVDRATKQYPSRGDNVTITVQDR